MENVEKNHGRINPSEGINLEELPDGKQREMIARCAQLQGDKINEILLSTFNLEYYRQNGGVFTAKNLPKIIEKVKS